MTLKAVRVLDCRGRGTWSGVIAGVDWVTADHLPGASAVANMSLGGGGNSALDTAIRNSIIDGVTYVVGAGNSNANACNYSPARVTEAITVGATTSTDAEASFSNYGTCVDLLAPGVSITSAWRTSDTATNTISGTSMASPHVAGGAARVLQANSGASPATVAATLTGSATAGVITLKSASASAGTPNRLLYLASGSVTPLPTVDSFTATLSTITLGDSSTLAWTATNATSWSINNGVGAVSGPNDSVQVSPTATTTYTLTATSPGGTATDTATVTVTAPPPTVDTFTPTLSTITLGDSSTLAWTTTNATSVAIDNGVGSGLAANGNTSVSPTATTTYTLTATGPGGSATDTATVTVTAPPPAVTGFTATPSTIDSGNSSTLAWTTTNTTSVAIDNGVGSSLDPDGNTSVSPTDTTTYTLTATGPGGTATDTATDTAHRDR